MIKSQCQCHALPSLVFIPQSNGYGYSSQSSMVAEFYVLLINYNSRRWSCRFSRSEYWQTSEWLHFVFKPLLKEHVYFLALAFSYLKLKYQNSFNPKRCRFFGQFQSYRDQVLQTLTIYCGTPNWLCVHKMLNNGLNHGLFISLFKLIPCPIH